MKITKSTRTTNLKALCALLFTVGMLAPAAYANESEDMKFQMECAGLQEKLNPVIRNQLKVFNYVKEVDPDSPLAQTQYWPLESAVMTLGSNNLVDRIGSNFEPDYFGNPYYLEIVEGNGNILSAGFDGKPGTDDDMHCPSQPLEMFSKITFVETDNILLQDATKLVPKHMTIENMGLLGDNSLLIRGYVQTDAGSEDVSIINSYLTEIRKRFPDLKIEIKSITRSSEEGKTKTHFEVE